jgi:hypothetical protein
MLFGIHQSRWVMVPPPSARRPGRSSSGLEGGQGLDILPRAMERLPSHVSSTYRAACQAGRRYSSLRIIHRSGKSGWLRVRMRYSAPSLPPVPRRVPMVRCTIFTWR